MVGSAMVIDALNTVFANLLSLEQEAHLQEHRFERMGYGFSDWFHCIEEKGHTHLIHTILNRIEQLGGNPVSRYAWPPDPATDDIGQALTSILKAMQTVHSQYRKACDIAEADDDYVTEDLIWCSLKWLEKRMGKFEARIAQCEKIGVKAFTAEFI